jgi:pyruvate dehydrogenase E2 component (dihydrolipoamide acetyltransferase)
VGEGIATADIVEWRVAAGDHVREGQDLVEVQTDKAIVVIPCPATGIVTRLGAGPGESLPVGAVLAVFATQTAGEQTSSGTVASPAPTDGPDAVTARDGGSRPLAAPGGSRPLAAPGGSRPLAAPAVRRLARELGIDLAAVSGSGPHGRIMREDLRPSPEPEPPTSARATGEPAPAAPPRSPTAVPGETVPLRGVRRAIAQTLTRAWQEIPHMTDYREVDATRLMEARRLLRQRAHERGDEALAQALTPTALIARAAATALGEHPYVNASIDLEREEITLHRKINLGIATATPQGLVVPVVQAADTKSVTELAIEISEIVHHAREGRLGPAELAGGTFTVNNYGGLGIWLGTPIIRPPEVANLGVGAVRDQVVAVEGEPRVRPILVLAVSGDHRVLDGHTLAAFVTRIVELLEQPLLLLEGLR